MLWHRLRGRVKQRPRWVKSFPSQQMTNGVCFLGYCQEILPFPSVPSLSTHLNPASLTVPPWNPWINNSSHRFFTLWLNRKFIPYPILPATHLSEGAHKTLCLFTWDSETRKSPQQFSLPLTALGSSLEPQNVVSAPLELLCFLLSIHPLFPSCSSLSQPSSRHESENLRQWQTLTAEPAILVPLCISIMEQLDMETLLSGCSLHTECFETSVNRETGERSTEAGGEGWVMGLWLLQQWD